MSTILEATVAMLARQVVMLERQVSALMLRRGAPFALARTTLTVNDTGPVQTVQAQLDALSMRDNIPLLYGFGVTGSPPIGADLHLAFLDGDRAKSRHRSPAVTRPIGCGAWRWAIPRSTTAAAPHVWLTAGGPVGNVGHTGNARCTGDLHVTGSVIAGPWRRGSGRLADAPATAPAAPGPAPASHRAGT